MLIKNVTIADPVYEKQFLAHILIKDGKIAKIINADSETGKTITEDMVDSFEISGLEGDGREDVIDARGLMASPGLLDVHVHFRDPGFTYKEDIETGAKAAAKGGYTTVIMMANTKPSIDNVETLSYVLEKGKKTGIKVKSCCAITKGLKGQEIVNMEEMLAAGAVGFTDDGIPILDEEVLRSAMKMAAKCKAPVSLHEENPRFIKNNGINAGKASEYYGIGGSDRMAEIDLVGRDIEIALETGAVLNVQHISAKEAVELVRQGKKRGNNIHAEATPHHFTLTEEATITYGTLAKMNPPLRMEEDRMAIIEALQDGTIDIIATDHAPHAKEEKDKPVTEAPSGILGLETAFALGYTQLVEKEYLTISELLRKMSVNPARLYGLEPACIREGNPADLFLWDKDTTFTVEGFASKSSNSPFLGWELKGRVEYTICDGKIIYKRDGDYEQ